MRFFDLLRVEINRALHRRLVWTLVAMALVGTVVAATIGFVDSADLDIAQLRREGGSHGAVMTTWWMAGGGDSLLLVVAFMLAMGGLIGGASVVGAEWRAGTVTTVLTWEPRRVRLHGARAGAAFLCAAVISFALQVVFLAAFLPAVFVHGTAAGADGAWFASLAAAMGRISLITAMAAVVGASLAALGRNTTAALVVGWGWLAIGENLVRNLLPDLQPFLLGENVALLLTWANLDGVDFSRSPVVALATLAVYTCGLAAASAVRFHRYDIAAT